MPHTPERRARLEAALASYRRALVWLQTCPAAEVERRLTERITRLDADLHPHRLTPAQAQRALDSLKRFTAPREVTTDAARQRTTVHLARARPRRV